jgi:diamine N-acetyltransferase
MALQLHKCTAEDMDQLVWISTSTFREVFGPLNAKENLEEYIDKAFNYQQLKSEMDNKNAAFYFCYNQDKLIGYFKINREEAQLEKFDAKSIELERIYVLKEFRNKKFGQKMLEKAIQLGRETGVEFIWLGVWENNSGAIKFYQRNGFEKFSQHTFLLGKDLQTDNLMRLYL